VNTNTALMMVGITAVTMVGVTFFSNRFGAFERWVRGSGMV